MSSYGGEISGFIAGGGDSSYGGYEGDIPSRYKGGFSSFGGDEKVLSMDLNFVFSLYVVLIVCLLLIFVDSWFSWALVIGVPVCLAIYTGYKLFKNKSPYGVAMSVL